MDWILGLVLLFGRMPSELAAMKDLDQTFVNDDIFYQGIVFEIIQNSSDAVKCVDGNKLYLKPERIRPSDQGLILVGDDDSNLLLPMLYSDRKGCFLKSYITCACCGFKLPDAILNCPECRGEK